MTLRIALMVLAISMGGCRTSVAPACRDICACSPCTDTDFDACVTKAEAAQERAESVGCRAQFETFLGCFEDTVTCESGAASTSRCTRVEGELRACADAGNPFASVCDEAAAKAAACTGGEPKPFGSCVGVQKCQLECILEADCEVIVGAKPDQAFFDCTNACFGAAPKPE